MGLRVIFIPCALREARVRANLGWRGRCSWGAGETRGRLEVSAVTSSYSGDSVHQHGIFSVHCHCVWMLCPGVMQPGSPDACSHSSSICNRHLPVGVPLLPAIWLSFMPGMAFHISYQNLPSNIYVIPKFQTHPRSNFTCLKDIYGSTLPR